MSNNNDRRKPWLVHTQQDMNDQWMFWVLAPNNATVAKSCRRYTTERGAVRGAVNMLDAWRSNGIEVMTR
jgi:uncharacterized protein YegP (UPF0339 family)